MILFQMLIAAYPNSIPSSTKVDWNFKMPEYAYERDFIFQEAKAYIEAEENGFVPIKRSQREVCTDYNPADDGYSYAGGICECTELKSDLHYRNAQAILGLFDAEGPLKDDDVIIYPEIYYPQYTDIGIAYNKTLLYKALSGDWNYYPIPDCYHGIGFINHSSLYDEERITKTITDQNGRNHTFEIYTIAVEDAYFIQIDVITGGGTAYLYVMKT